MVKFLMSLLKFNFGEFEEREFRKFLRMGMILLVIVGSYWGMRPLKDSIFIQLAGAVNLPYAKTVSVFFMIFFVAIYTKLLDFISKPKLLSLMPPVLYGSIMVLYAAFIWAFQNGMIASSMLTVVLGYIWYFFIESFGSVVIALFWAFAADITKADSAKRGFPLIYLFAQIGGVCGPYLFVNLPVSLGVKSDAVSMVILALLTLLVPVLVKHLLKKTPEDLLAPPVSEETSERKPKKQKTGFMEGLKLLFTHKYLLGIFASILFFEFIATVFDFNFKMAAGEVYHGTELSRFLSIYGSCVNLVSLIFLLLGISNITKRFGIGKTLASVPIIMGVGIIGFLTNPKLSLLFILMIACKAINYALSGPALKQLYVPTSKDAKSKAQAWIETFGSRFSKEVGAGVSMLYKPLGAATYRIIASGIGFAFVVAWFFVALFLGKTYKKAVDSNTIVC